MTKRLFFATEIHAPWPESYPEGRLLAPDRRHLTLAFLGNVEPPDCANFPEPPIKLGVAGVLDELLILKNVVACHANVWQKENRLTQLKCDLESWRALSDERPFLPHVTIARAPFDEKKWKESFSPLPFMTSTLHLYESLGNLCYEPIWSFPLVPPIEEMEHTADIAFRIRGEDLQEIYRNAQLALSFHHPEMLPELRPHEEVTSLDEIIFGLNDFISRVDTKMGASYKAVSFHGSIVQENEIKTWEMIVDV